MKKLILISAICALFSFNAVANSIGVLDVEKIVKESKAMRDIQKKVADQQEKYQKEVTAKQTVLEKEQKTLEGKKLLKKK